MDIDIRKIDSGVSLPIGIRAETGVACDTCGSLCARWSVVARTIQLQPFESTHAWAACDGCLPVYLGEVHTRASDANVAILTFVEPLVSRL